METREIGDLNLALCSVGELFGGVERQLLGLCDYLRRRGRQPRLLLFCDHELADQARQLGIEPEILPARHSYDLKTSACLARWVAGNGIHVVHAHGYRAMVNCALAYRRRPFALVKTEHGLPEGGRHNPIGWFKSQLYYRLESWATQATGATVCYVTDDIRRHWRREHRGLSGRTIHNGIDPLDAATARRPAEFEPGCCHLVIVGRIAEVKGIDFALQAMATGVPAAVRLHIIGTGPAQDRLQRRAQQLSLGQRVRFLGFRRNVYDYLAHCDALLMPSLHEGLPYTLLEAMSLGRTILASRVGGLAEVLGDDRTAWLFTPRDVAGIRQAILRLCRQPDQARRLGEAARQDQRSRFTLTAMGDRYWAVYREALEASRGARQHVS